MRPAQGAADRVVAQHRRDTRPGAGLHVARLRLDVALGAAAVARKHRAALRVREHSQRAVVDEVALAPLHQLVHDRPQLAGACGQQ